MKGIIHLVIGVIALVEIIYHFIQSSGSNGKFFGYEISEPIYIGIWALICGMGFYNFYKINKNQTLK